MICYYLFVNPTWPSSRGRAWELAHLAVRQQAAVGVGAGPAAPGLSGRVGLRQLPRGHERHRGAGAAGVDPRSRRPPPRPKSGLWAQAGLWHPEPLQLGGEVLVGQGGGQGAGHFFLLLPLLGVCAAASWCCSRIWRDGRRLLIFCSLPLLLLAGTRGEEGANAVLLFFLKLRRKQAEVTLLSHS